MLTADEIRILGQVTDTTWGRSSTTGVSTASVKCKLSGKTMTLSYITYATFASDIVLSRQMPALKNEGEKILDSTLKSIKEKFKTESGRSLKTKLLNVTDSVEIIGSQTHISPKRTVIFRYTGVFSIE